jgi:hypothetical protein
MQTYEPPIQMLIKSFHNFIFMNVKVEKNLSSSIDPIIWTITNYVIFINLDDGENGHFVNDKK